MIGKDILPLWPDESEETKKLKADFSMVLEVLRCVSKKCQGIQTSGEKLKGANQILSASLEEYEVPPSRAVTLNGNGKPEIASDGRNVHNGVPVEGQCFGLT
jgi:hypothetical protein